MQPRIKSINPADIEVFMLGLIGKTYLNCGYTFDKSLVNSTLDDLTRGLTTAYKEMTLQEVAICFERGYKRKYDKLDSKHPEILILGNSTYFRWLDHWQWDADRLRVKGMLSVAKEIAVKKKELSDEDKLKIIRDGTLDKFKTFKETGILSDFGNIAYAYLERLKLINFTLDVKKLILNDCKIRMIEAEKMKKTEAYYIGKHQGINDEIKQIEEGKSSRLIAECKREALKQYFIQLIEMDEQLTNLI
jgi:hypothetical protein